MAMLMFLSRFENVMRIFMSYIANFVAWNIWWYMEAQSSQFLQKNPLDSILDFVIFPKKLF